MDRLEQIQGALENADSTYIAEYSVVRFNEMKRILPYISFKMLSTTLKELEAEMYSFVAADRNVSDKECALIVCCEEDDRSVLDGVRTPFERTVAYLKW